MSRIGLAPITVPSGVDVKINDNNVSVKGKLGQLERTFSPKISVKQDGDVITVSRSNDEPESRSLHGLTRSLLNNMVVGVSDGFQKRLQLAKCLFGSAGFALGRCCLELRADEARQHLNATDVQAGVHFAACAALR